MSELGVKRTMIMLARAFPWPHRMRSLTIYEWTEMS